jgi:hypothetical protein
MLRLFVRLVKLNAKIELRICSAYFDYAWQHRVMRSPLTKQSPLSVSEQNRISRRTNLTPIASQRFAREFRFHA